MTGHRGPTSGLPNVAVDLFAPRKGSVPVAHRISIEASGCWLWTGARSGSGYGNLWANGRNALAHRVVWESLVGPIPPGLTLDHLCRNQLCVNPDHLEVVTTKVNTMRGTSFAAVNARKTQCPRGHPYEGKNLIRYGNGRFCRACAQDRPRPTAIDHRTDVRVG